MNVRSPQNWGLGAVRQRLKREWLVLRFQLLQSVPIAIAPDRSRDHC